MGIGWETYHKGVPCPWGSLKIPLKKPRFTLKSFSIGALPCWQGIISTAEFISLMRLLSLLKENPHTLQRTNISPKNAILKVIFLFPRWDMLIPWRVLEQTHVFPWNVYFEDSKINYTLPKWTVRIFDRSFWGVNRPIFKGELSF